MKEYISWACEYNKNSGEGNLARIYLKSLKEKKIKLITPKYKFYLSNYIYKILGILVVKLDPNKVDAFWLVLPLLNVTTTDLTAP